MRILMVLGCFDDLRQFKHAFEIFADEFGCLNTGALFVRSPSQRVSVFFEHF